MITSQPAGLDGSGSFRYQLAVDDPDGDRRLRYRLAQGPEGMRIDSIYGGMTWTPGESQAGKHHVVVEVDDNAGGVATQAFDLEIEFVDAEAKPAPASPE